MRHRLDFIPSRHLAQKNKRKKKGIKQCYWNIAKKIGLRTLVLSDSLQPASGLLSFHDLKSVWSYKWIHNTLNQLGYSWSRTTHKALFLFLSVEAVKSSGPGTRTRNFTVIKNWYLLRKATSVALPFVVCSKMQGVHYIIKLHLNIRILKELEFIFYSAAWSVNGKI